MQLLNLFLNKPKTPHATSLSLHLSPASLFHSLLIQCPNWHSYAIYKMQTKRLKRFRQVIYQLEQAADKLSAVALSLSHSLSISLALTVARIKNQTPTERRKSRNS